MADNLNVRNGPTFFSSDDEGDDKQRKARRLVMEYYNELIQDSVDPIELEDTYVVLFSYVLGSWKALISTVLPDGRYYEVTYNSAKNETYVDEYQKRNHVTIREF